MARYAVIENGRVTNIVEADEATANSHGWILAARNTKKDDLLIDGQIVSVAERLEGNNVDPIKYQLLFTLAERIAIRAARTTDPGCEELLRMVDDPRLESVDLDLKSTQDGIDYLIANGYVAPERKAQILAGIIQ